ncbi:MAG: hypothetical protein LBO04_08430 [Spirochaetaceae bacterium]|jgi:hypothetical protein|nr:hypothetical protein [Spirochaetaceae bacterium]
MKIRSLIFGFAAALLGAAFILAGCEQETKTEYVNVNVPAPGAYEPPENAVPADNFAVLQALLADTSGVYTDIVYKDVPDQAITVPVGKTLYLFKDALGLTADITVNGKVVVYGGGTTLTPGDHFKAGTGTLDVEEGIVSVDEDKLFAGDARPAAVSIKKGAKLTHTGTPLAAAADLTKWVGYAGDGSLELSQPITATVTPKAAMDAIGAQPEGKTVTLTVNLAPGGGETSLSVPAGVILTTNQTFADVTSLTVNGTLNASSASFAAVTSLTVNGTLDAETATLAAAGASISLGAKADATLGAAKISGSFEVPASANLLAVSIAAGSGVTPEPTITFKAGRTDYLISDIDLVFSAFGISGGTAAATLADDVTLAAGKNIIISVPSGGGGPSAIEITLPAGKTITNNGTFRLGEGVSLILATTAEASAKIAGEGSILAGATTIAGAWEATGTADGTVTILSADEGATITAAADATGLKAGSGAAIAQAKGVQDNALTIAASTKIELGGGGSTPVGAIVLQAAEAGGHPGTLKLMAATSVISTEISGDTAGTALSAAGGLFVTTAANNKALCSAISDSTGVAIYPATSATTKLFKITGGSAASTIKATLPGGGDGNDIEIDSESAVTSS